MHCENVLTQLHPVPIIEYIAKMHMQSRKECKYTYSLAALEVIMQTNALFDSRNINYSSPTIVSLCNKRIYLFFSRSFWNQ